MPDIVERLLDPEARDCCALRVEAAYEIERLREAVKRMADLCAEEWMPHEIRSFRAMQEARAALGEEK